MNKTTILIGPNHQLFSSVQTLKQNKQYQIVELENEAVPAAKFESLGAELVLDLSLISRERKQALLHMLTALPGLKLISELSCYWGEQLMQRYPQITGALATAFYSPKQTYEYVARDEVSEQAIQQFLSDLKLQGLKVPCAGLGFTFPRTISMIINEAYFALEEKLCLAEDLDTAMKYGVNYPLGPIEWGKKIGEAQVLRLLDELHDSTRDPRYRAALQLRLKSETFYTQVIKVFT